MGQLYLYSYEYVYIHSIRNNKLQNNFILRY